MLVGMSRKVGSGGSGAQERGLDRRGVWGLERGEHDIIAIMPSPPLIIFKAAFNWVPCMFQTLCSELWGDSLLALL